MPLSLTEVEDLIDSWELDPRLDTVPHATELLATMSVGDPGRVDVLQVIADHQSMRGDVDAALATLDLAVDASGEQADVVAAMRIGFLIEAGRGAEVESQLVELRRRGSALPVEAVERVCDALEQDDRLSEAQRWYTIALRDLDPRLDLPDQDETYLLFGRLRVRRALGLASDSYDELARVLLEERHF